MPLPLAYILVVFIWSTTPIAIQFSQKEVSYYAALSVRMWIAALVCFVVIKLLKLPLALHRRAVVSYFAGSIGIYFSMLCVYWSAKYIPSGLISVLFGLSPMLTGVVAYFFMNERELSPIRVAMLAIAVFGLSQVVMGQAQVDDKAMIGIMGTLVSVLGFVISGLGVKHAGASLHPLVQTTGTLIFSSIGFLVTLPFFEFSLNQQGNYDLISLGAIAYLAIFGSVFGFVFYYYILKHMPATQVAMITLIAPILAVTWGVLLQGEWLSDEALIGSGLVLISLLIYIMPWSRPKTAITE